jgi:outer membrane protein
LLGIVPIGCLLAFGVVAEAAAQSVTNVYLLALKNDPKFLAMRSEYEATGFAVKEARAGLLPTVSYQVGRTNTTQNIVSSDNAVFATGTATYPTNDSTLSITQPIFRLAAWRNWSQAQASERQAAAAFAAAEQDLILRTATAYLGVLAAQDALLFARGESDSVKRQLDLAEAKFKSGQSTRVSLNEAQSRLAVIQSNVVGAENDLADKMQALRELTGELSPGLLPMPKALGLAMPMPEQIEEWVRKALADNLLLKAREQAVDVAFKDLDKRKGGYFPTLDLTYSNNGKVTGGSLFGGGSNVNTNEMVIRLNIPIYEGGATSAQAGQAAKHYETALQDLERDKRQVERQTRAAYLGIVGGAVKVRALELSVSALEGSRQLKEEGYKAGIQTILTVLDANRDLFAARRDFAQARYDFVLSTMKLRQAAGTLAESDLLQIAGSSN